ncbi:hypothetical protein HYPSUDRAFT_76191 [Hypholoma sublateritium FD-334 SS-4]|uniref:Uncharacterized protein n=1 Tax=Hypholoma sublateritium (strain FD-334 SS-4) TaxID=945553 RepID=A0A0D2Q101_HYPSF|nr:hypothetical protein HYPSUDRAFT_76191 [Hypholoma sublateritium FD-334 SS-4]
MPSFVEISLVADTPIYFTKYSRKPEQAGSQHHNRNALLIQGPPRRAASAVPVRVSGEAYDIEFSDGIVVGAGVSSVTFAEAEWAGAALTAFNADGAENAPADFWRGPCPHPWCPCPFRARAHGAQDVPDVRGARAAPAPLPEMPALDGALHVPAHVAVDAPAPAVDAARAALVPAAVAVHALVVDAALARAADAAAAAASPTPSKSKTRA